MTKSIDLPEESKAELAHNYITQLKNLVYQQGLSILEIGRLLIIFRDKKLYLALQFDNFKQFVSDSDVSIAPSTAYSFCRIYEIFCMKLQFKIDDLSEIPWSKLQLLSTVVDPKNRKEAERWISKAKAMGAGDFADEVAEYKHNTNTKLKLPYPHIRRCKDCSYWRIEAEKGTVCKCVDNPAVSQV